MCVELMQCKDPGLPHYPASTWLLNSKCPPLVIPASHSLLSKHP